jgi:hypothetical protein
MFIHYVIIVEDHCRIEADPAELGKNICGPCRIRADLEELRVTKSVTDLSRDVIPHNFKSECYSAYRVLRYVSGIFKGHSEIRQPPPPIFFSVGNFSSP